MLSWKVTEIIVILPAYLLKQVWRQRQLDKLLKTRIQVPQPVDLKSSQFPEAAGPNISQQNYNN